MSTTVIIIGRLGSDAELKESGSGVKYCRLGVAVTRYDYALKDKVTDWHNVTFFNQQAENAAKILKKGDAVSIRGCLENRQKTKADAEFIQTEVHPYEWELISRPNKEGSLPEEPTEGSEESTDDIPF